MRVIVCNKDFDWNQLYDSERRRQDWLSLAVEEADSDCILAQLIPHGSSYGGVVKTIEGKTLQTTYDNFYRPEYGELDDDGNPVKPEISWYDEESQEWKDSEVVAEEDSIMIEIHPGGPYHWGDMVLEEKCFMPDSCDGDPLDLWIKDHSPLKVILTEW